MLGYFQGKQGSKEGEFTLKITFIGNESSETFNNSAITLRDALVAHHNIGTTVNDYVKCIDGVCAGSDYHWQFYANDVKANYGVDSYPVSEDDIIEFRFEMS